MPVVAGYLGQATPPGTKPMALFSPAVGEIVRVTGIFVCNHTAGALTFTIYLNNTGNLFLPENYLYNDEPLAANETLVLPRNEDGGNRPAIWMDNPNGAIGVQSSVGGSITFSAFGIRTS